MPADTRRDCAGNFLRRITRAHSTRSVVLEVKLPAVTTQPSRLIEYGYVAVTVTSVPAAQAEFTVTLRFDWLRSAADVRTAVVAAPVGSASFRETAAMRAPA